MAWLLEQGLPDDVCIGTVDSYLCAQLGAGFATDLSTASRTQLARLGEYRWDNELCAIFGVRSSCLPAVRDSVGELGTLRHERWRTELPLRAQVVDQQAALAGAGCVVPGRAKATFGTGVFVLTFMGAAAPAGAAAAGVVPTVAWSIGGVPQYALDGGDRAHARGTRDDRGDLPPRVRRARCDERLRGDRGAARRRRPHPI